MTHPAPTSNPFKQPKAVWAVAYCVACAAVMPKATGVAVSEAEIRASVGDFGQTRGLSPDARRTSS